MLRLRTFALLGFSLAIVASCGSTPPAATTNLAVSAANENDVASAPTPTPPPRFDDLLERTNQTPERVYLIAGEGAAQRCQPLEWKGLTLYEADAPPARDARVGIYLRPGSLENADDGQSAGRTVVLTSWVVHRSNVDPAQHSELIAGLGPCSATYDDLSAVSDDFYAFGNVRWYRSMPACEAGRVAHDRAALDAQCIETFDSYSHAAGTAITEALRRMQNGGTLHELRVGVGRGSPTCTEWRFDARAHTFVHSVDESVNGRRTRSVTTYRYELDGNFLVVTGPRMELHGNGEPRTMHMSDYRYEYIFGIDDHAVMLNGNRWYLDAATCAAATNG